LNELNSSGGNGSDVPASSAAQGQEQPDLGALTNSGPSQVTTQTASSSDSDQRQSELADLAGEEEDEAAAKAAAKEQARLETQKQQERLAARQPQGRLAQQAQLAKSQSQRDRTQNATRMAASSGDGVASPTADAHGVSGAQPTTAIEIDALYNQDNLIIDAMTFVGSSTADIRSVIASYNSDHWASLRFVVSCDGGPQWWATVHVFRDATNNGRGGKTGSAGGFTCRQASRDAAIKDALTDFNRHGGGGFGGLTIEYGFVPIGVRGIASDDIPPNGNTGRAPYCWAAVEEDPITREPQVDPPGGGSGQFDCGDQNSIINLLLNEIR
jgi:hypothetical protein